MIELNPMPRFRLHVSHLVRRMVWWK